MPAVAADVVPRLAASAAGMTSARSFTLSGGGGGRSDISSLSSWRHRQHSDDDNAAGHEGKLAGRCWACALFSLLRTCNRRCGCSLFNSTTDSTTDDLEALLINLSVCLPLLYHAGDSAGGALAAGDVQRALSSSADLAAALDDVRSGSSVAALQDELAEKNRIIEQLQVCAACVVVRLIVAALWEHVDGLVWPLRCWKSLEFMTF